MKFKTVAGYADLSALDNSGTDDQNASEVFYDNTISGLGGNEVQSAIDQLAIDVSTTGVASINGIQTNK